MPTPIMHLALAEELLRGDALLPHVRGLLTAQRGPFLLGHTAPDVQSVSGQAREETHFYTIPRTTDIPAHEAMFTAHPRLARAEALPPAHAAFVAGYIAHLALDELWLDDVFLRYFGAEWGTPYERAFLHNVLRTWLDHQDHQRLNGDVTLALRATEPRGWLPFVADAYLWAWRDWLTEQLEPGCMLQTAAVFAERMGVSAAEVEAVLSSAQEMEERVFSHIPRAALESFRAKGYTQAGALLNEYIGR